jgi:hypothetical protein
MTYGEFEGRTNWSTILGRSYQIVGQIRHSPSHRIHFIFPIKDILDGIPPAQSALFHPLPWNEHYSENKTHVDVGLDWMIAILLILCS